ncbi:1-acyl-sn-glycerol-3-phosphate acyltransferase [Actinacidiphila guanduensis]|uniref:1-acyl-sn-glycerol-3-phosphate acyltransferase n=2 Tax=Actinacidiphila guanduensis TaxID=310781 RepID=A0A1H0DK25_9ACTN|nr:1-acyl-sn-glycerol-3-phosphate acyltransferase [Actinacidiphila guanduensis]
MFYGAMKIVLGKPIKAAFRPWVEGIENIPAEGPAILASNHLSFSDSFFLPAVLDRKVTFIAKAEYFTTPGVKGKLTAAFFKGVGQLPVDRSGARGAGEAAVRSGIAVLERGELFGIYPEGTRSPDGRLYRGKPGGLARVALATGAPVIPVAMIDTEKVQPVGQVMPKLSIRPGIRIGRPLDFSRYRGMESDRFILRSVTDEVMYEIMKLSGQEYVDIYATAAKRQIAEAAKAAAAEASAGGGTGGKGAAPGPGPGSAGAGEAGGSTGTAGPAGAGDGGGAGGTAGSTGSTGTAGSTGTGGGAATK